MDQVLSFLQKAAGLLGALVAGGIIKSNSGTQIAGILADLQSVISGAQNPSTELIVSVTNLLNDLKVDNVISGTFVDEIAQGLTKFGAFVHDVQTGQVAVIDDKAKLAGVEGLYAFIPAGSEVAHSIGY